MNNLDIYEKTRMVPQEAQKTIKGGRIKGMTDINPMWRIKVLTELFGPCGVGWYYKPVRKWTETVGSETAAFVDIELYVKQDGEWSMPISGTGGNMLAKKEEGGIYVSDECYKMATTDAISVACKQLGIGADIYWSSDRTKYDDVPQREAKEPKNNRKGSSLIITVQAENILKEMERTGVSTKQILYSVGKKNMNDLTETDYKDIMERFEHTPDAPPINNGITPPPPDIPDNDEGLPFK